MAQLESLKIYEKSKISFLNEIRGAMLEFSCANSIAQKFNFLEKFYKNLPTEIYHELLQYQDFMRENDPEGLEFITKVGHEFGQKLSGNDLGVLNSIYLTGKTKLNNHIHESDIVLDFQKKQQMISLKLIKMDSFINSKSAGSKSFFSKYFNDEIYQQFFNQQVTNHFQNFKIRFFNFFDAPIEKYTFNELCRLENITDRPGQLPEELRLMLFDFYAEIIKMIFDYFDQKINDSKFQDQLRPLMGLGNEKIKVCVVEYKKSFKNYKINFYDVNEFSTRNFMVCPISGHTSFNIDLDKLILQIRVKPMNSFTAPSLKVNCSIKFKGNK